VFRVPKDDGRYSWTWHVIEKMKFYGISPSRVKRVIRFPKRTEEGIAPKTAAVMKRNDTPKKKEEVWVMYQKLTNNRQPIASNATNATNNKIRVISAWRYPGISPKGKEIPIPEDILNELENIT